jgi:serine/threonine protein phosphatase 1
MRSIAIGDIHGANRALIQLLDRFNYDPSSDKLIFLGDYIDGWPESKEVITTLIELHKNNPNIIFLRGNHDDWMCEFIEDGEFRAPYIWYNQGGKETLESYKLATQKQMDDVWVKGGLDDDHKNFFTNTHFYYIDAHNKGFVHAGYVSKEGLGHDLKAFYMWDRDIAYMLPMKTLDPFPKCLRAHNELYIGHTSTLLWKTTEPISLRGKYWNIDTGAGWNGKLTAIDTDTKEYWQSDIVKTLYPEIKR